MVRPILVAVLTLLFVAMSPALHAQSKKLPDGLFDGDPALRIEAINQVTSEKNTAALGKLSSMARSDSAAIVREAACSAIGEIGGEDQLDLLDYLASNDANAQVRSAAAKAARKLRGEPEPTTAGPILGPAAAGEEKPPAEETDPGYKMPTLKKDEPTLMTRHFAIGFGTMGGYGIAALNLRGRIPTGAPGLPWVGIEVGGGWTPPTGYAIVSGLTESVTDDDARWKIISAAGAVLLYLHRNHYIPMRAGWDNGQGPYAILGYGFEILNEEGFFSWGGELGILYHPVSDDWVENICDEPGAEMWPVVPYMRFVLHFYLA